MKRRSFLTAILVLISVPTQAQDYSPFPELAIKTLGISYDRSGYVEVRVAVKNNSSEPRDANFECTLFDAGGDPYTSIQGQRTPSLLHKPLLRKLSAGKNKSL